MAFKFRLNLRNKRIAEAYVKRAKDRGQEATQQIDKWIKGESNFERKKYIDLWEDYRKRYGDDVLHLALKTMAVGNSIVDVNHILRYNMGMPQAQINPAFITAALKKMFNVNMADLLLKDSQLDAKTQQSILERVILREFPMKGERQQAVPVNPTRQAMQMTQQIAREIKRGE